VASDQLLQKKVKYWEIIADNLKAGWNWGWCLSRRLRGANNLDCRRTLRRRKGFVVRADEKLTAFLELQTAIHEFAVSLIL
jgi:hypothetical protein